MNALARATDPGTSHDAAQSVSATVLEAQVLRAIRDSGDRGATLDEIMERTGLEKVTASPRAKPLEGKGLIVRAGKRPGLSGRAQTVWRAAA
jgi:DNA-binding MarR family transcriptional regulator